MEYKDFSEHDHPEEGYSELKEDVKSILASFFDKYKIVHSNEDEVYIEIPKKLRKVVRRKIGKLYEFGDEASYCTAQILELILDSPSGKIVTITDFVEGHVLEHIESFTTRLAVNALAEVAFSLHEGYFGTDGSITDNPSLYLPSLVHDELYPFNRLKLENGFEHFDEDDEEG